MQHKLKIQLSPYPDDYGGIVRWGKLTLRKRLLRRLLGDPCRVTVIVPGDSVKMLAIEELPDTEPEEARHE